MEIFPARIWAVSGAGKRVLTQRIFRFDRDFGILTAAAMGIACEFRKGQLS